MMFPILEKLTHATGRNDSVEPSAAIIIMVILFIIIITVNTLEFSNI